MTERVKRVRTVRDYKYKLRETYGDFHIYQHIVEYDISVVNEWLLTKVLKTGMEVLIQIQSFNNITYDELFDYIDEYCDKGLFNLKGFQKDDVFVVHPCGDVLI